LTVILYILLATGETPAWCLHWVLRNPAENH